MILKLDIGKKNRILTPIQDKKILSKVRVEGTDNRHLLKIQSEKTI